MLWKEKFPFSFGQVQNIYSCHMLQRFNASQENIHRGNGSIKVLIIKQTRSRNECNLNKVAAFMYHVYFVSLWAKCVGKMESALVQFWYNHKAACWPDSWISVRPQQQFCHYHNYYTKIRTVQKHAQSQKRKFALPVARPIHATPRQ